MTDAEAKKCLERVVVLDEQLYEVRQIEKWKPQNIYIPCLGLFLSLGGFIYGSCLKLKYEGMIPHRGILEWLRGCAIMIICIIVAVLFSIVLFKKISEYQRLKRLSKKYLKNNYTEKFSEKIGGVYWLRKALEFEREMEQLFDMLLKAFPEAAVAPNYARNILKYMSTGSNYYTACGIVKSDFERYEFFQRKREEREAEKNYKQAVLNEQRRTNENLENLQRQQAYANRLMREAEFRRIDEDMKRSVNKKWGE